MASHVRAVFASVPRVLLAAIFDAATGIVLEVETDDDAKVEQVAVISDALSLIFDGDAAKTLSMISGSITPFVNEAILTSTDEVWVLLRFDIPGKILLVVSGRPDLLGLVINRCRAIANG